MDLTGAIVVDVEIETPIDEIKNGWDGTDQMGVAVAVVYSFDTDVYHFYETRDVPQLQDRLVDHGGLVIGWNSSRFDIRVIFGLGRDANLEASAEARGINLGRWTEGDMLVQCKDACGFGAGQHPRILKLDQVASQTLGRGKIGEGSAAPLWWREGKRSKVITYCLDDVRLTRQLAEFAANYGYLLGGDGRRIPIW